MKLSELKSTSIVQETETVSADTLPQAAIDAATKKALALHEFHISIDVDHELALEAGMKGDSLEFDAPASESQEVYVGQSEDGNLFVGFDCWIDEKHFNEAWDEHFHQSAGEHFDDENEKHQAAFDDIWKKYIKMLGWSILFELEKEGERFTAEPALSSDEMSREGTFYTSIHKSSEFKRLKLKDIRKD